MTPWSRVTASGSNTTWGTFASVNSFNWLPYSTRTDAFSGVDFIPKASATAPFKLDTVRPAQVWNLSAITASGFTAERRP